MTSPKKFDLIPRCVTFAKATREFVKQLPQSDHNREYARQLIRSSSAIGANYIEANEALGSKDFYYRIGIARKEAKETRYWLELIDTVERTRLDATRVDLAQEAHELKLIFSSILEKRRKA
ncbi:four helix bundle protein [Candidatus Berkelbacteria bacterium]|nr:four helix bundle protein [Candidatus Berkelbacteria bacterium]